MMWSRRTRRRSRSEVGPNEEGALFRSDRELIQAAIFGVFILALFLIFSLGKPKIAETEGQRAKRDYVARVTFECRDYDKTIYLREQAKIPEVYELTDELGGKDRLLGDVRSGNLGRVALPHEGRALFGLLRDNLNQFALLLNEIERLGVISEEHYVAAAHREPPVLHVYDRHQREELERPLASVIVLSADNATLKKLIAKFCTFLSGPEQKELAVLLEQRLVPNLKQNTKLSREINQKRMAAVKSVRKVVPKGELMLAKGAPVRRQHLEEIHRERKAFDASDEGHKVRVQNFVGVGITMLLIVGIGAFYVLLFEPQILKDDARYVALLGWIVFLAVTTRLLYLYGVSEALVILPLWTMVLAVAYSRRFAAEMAVLGALFVGVAGYKFMPVIFVLAVGGIVTALVAGRARYRSDLLKAGVAAGLAELACVWGAGLIEVETRIGWHFWNSELFDYSLVLGLTAVASGFVASGTLPLIERVFSVTTNIGLLEWSDPNKPVLQRLLREASGTYHHSMLVGSLSADAAEAVGSNALLARVSSYYHDIGKLMKPEYFIENIRSGEQNRHDNLSPTMSSLIITAHTRDGVDLATRYGLPKVLKDVILQHHGTTRVEYFYRRAQEMSSSEEKVSGEAFRYRGPRPQSREAAIILICDSVEGATRAMRDAPPQKISAKIREIIMSRLMGGQLDESGLSMTDLYKIEQALIRSLNAIFHNRIPYPGEQEKEQHEPAAQA